MVENSKLCHGRSKNSSVVEFQNYFVSERPFFQFHEERAKFANEVHHLTRFFEKVDSYLPSRLMMLIRQPLKVKNGCKLTKNRIQSKIEPLLQLNEAKWLRQNDVSRKLEPSVYQNSTTFHGYSKYGVTKSYGFFVCRKSLKNVKSRVNTLRKKWRSRDQSFWQPSAKARVSGSWNPGFGLRF